MTLYLFLYSKFKPTRVKKNTQCLGDISKPRTHNSHHIAPPSIPQKCGDQMKITLFHGVSLSISVPSKANEIKEHMWRTHGNFENNIKNGWQCIWDQIKEQIGNFIGNTLGNKTLKLWKFELAIRGEGRAASQPICCQLKKDNDQCDL